MASQSKRKQLDIMKLMMNDYNVKTINDLLHEFSVEFHGPKESLYEGGVWKVLVVLSDAYPYESPYIGFINKIIHPNIDETSGSVCLDVINESWSPMFDLINVFEVFLPQLLLYPNPSHPLNCDAAQLMIQDTMLYEKKVKECIERYAKKESIVNSVVAGEGDSGGDEDDDITADDDEDPVHAHPLGTVGASENCLPSHNQSPL
ncbi:hypothetical protein LguiA_028139 [Lonicera macranthoides]